MSDSNETIGASGTAALEDIYPILNECGVEVLCWENSYVRCPGIDLHTTANADSDCKAFNNDGCPCLHCFHTRCREEIARANSQLLETAKGVASRRHCARPLAYSQAVKARQAEQKRHHQEAEDALPCILRDYAWPVASLATDSPEEIDISDCDHWKALMALLFKDEDILWCGRDPQDSGSPNHRWRFRPVGEWLSRRHCPGTHICPNTFKPGVWSRSNPNVAVAKYLVVESDELNHDQIAAVFRWLEVSVGMRLRAIVDTAGKSLHGWFDHPSPGLLTELKACLPLLGCDPAMFTLSQPCRLPGVIRPETGRYQRLLYLNPST